MKNTAVTAAGAIAIPTIVPPSVFGQTAPSNRINIGCIGVGNQGGGLMKNALYNNQAHINKELKYAFKVVN